MGLVKIYLNDAEEAELRENAKDKGLSLSAYAKERFKLKSTTNFSLALADSINRAIDVPPGTYSLPDLFTKAEWRAFQSNNVNLGQLGRRFNGAVERGNVTGMTFKKGGKGNALYVKV